MQFVIDNSFIPYVSDPTCEIIASAENGQLVTTELCMSAAGHYVPPIFIFPR